MTPSSYKSGFTLIELIIVLILIGILAAVAIPRFANLQDNAETASIQGTLGNVRSAITIWRADSLSNGTDAWPPHSSNMTDVLDSPMPPNPHLSDQTNASVVDDAAGLASGVRTITGDTTAGWRYNPDTGEFWANTGSGDNEL